MVPARYPTIVILLSIASEQRGGGREPQLCLKIMQSERCVLNLLKAMRGWLPCLNSGRACNPRKRAGSGRALVPFLLGADPGDAGRGLGAAEAYRRPWTAAEQHPGEVSHGMRTNSSRMCVLRSSLGSRRMTWLKQRIADHCEQRDGHSDHQRKHPCSPSSPGQNDRVA
jgi:hypothetical protein